MLTKVKNLEDEIEDLEALNSQHEHKLTTAAMIERKLSMELEHVKNDPGRDTKALSAEFSKAIIEVHDLKAEQEREYGTNRHVINPSFQGRTTRLSRGVLIM